jgi:hypothetical protein
MNHESVALLPPLLNSGGDAGGMMAIKKTSTFVLDHILGCSFFSPSSATTVPVTTKKRGLKPPTKQSKHHESNPQMTLLLASPTTVLTTSFSQDLIKSADESPDEEHGLCISCICVWMFHYPLLQHCNSYPVPAIFYLVYSHFITGGLDTADDDDTSKLRIILPGS